MNDRYSKLVILHRVKERKTPSLSAQASFAPFSLKVAWSGKSLIVQITYSEDSPTGLNIKAFEPPAHRAKASLVRLAHIQNLLARNISDTESDIQII